MGTPPDEPGTGGASPWARPDASEPAEPGSSPEQEQHQPTDPAFAHPSSPETPTSPGPGGPGGWGRPTGYAPGYGQPQYGQPQYGGPPSYPYGQHPAYGGSPGTGQFPQQPGYGSPAGPHGTNVWAAPQAPGWGQPTQGWGGPYPPRPRRRFPWKVVGIVLGALLLVALIIVGLLAFVVGPKFARVDVLDGDAVAQGVTRVVTEDWRRQITGVSCPSDQEVRPGVRFTCSATVDGRPAQVPVAILDQQGTYSVGQPR